MQETVDYYRQQNIAFCLFTVDCESGIGAKRIRNEEIAELASANADIVIPFASIDPHKGKLEAREARDLIENHGVRGFKFHPPMQDFDPADRVAYPTYEVIAEYGLPAIFHTGHSGMGTGLKGGGGIKLKYGRPMLVDEVAVDFPQYRFHTGASKLALDRRKSVDGAAQKERLYRPERLVTEVLSGNRLFVMPTVS
ncbi:MAG: amidohydrolase family protein [Woeseiaceae bacterium]|nr:amidohydrolase family protein [Woeseiaceae bacterium]